MNLIVQEDKSKMEKQNIYDVEALQHFEEDLKSMSVDTFKEVHRIVVKEFLRRLQ